MLGRPFEFIEYYVLALVLPVILEHVLEYRAQLLTWRDAFIVVRLNEQLDVAG